MKIEIATIEDVPELMDLQKIAFTQVAQEVNWPEIPNLHESLEHAVEDFPHYTTLKMINDEGCIVGSIRGNVENDSLYIGRLMVLPQYQGHGYGSELIRRIEAELPHSRAWLNTCEQLLGNVRLYSRHGYIPFDHERINDCLTRVFMEKFPSEN